MDLERGSTRFDMSEPTRPDETATHDRLDQLERRLRNVEDVLLITRLVIAYGFATDTGNSEVAADIWAADGVFDRGSGLDGGDGGDSIAARLSRPEHLELIRRGIVHFTGVPHVVVDGDGAIATHYQQIIVPDETAEPVRRGSAWQFPRLLDPPGDGKPLGTGAIRRRMDRSTPDVAASRHRRGTRHHP